ncbi:MAG: transposase [Pseudomonadota bacterium]|nr:transposase [Pseudomonadota bacterium]
MNTEPVTRAIVLRLYLNRAQRSALRRWQGGLRRAWNATLDLCFKRREREGKWPNKAAIQNFVVGLKKQEATVWMAEIPAHALLALADDMHKAFQNWFQKRAKRPKFRGKFQRQFSVYMVNQRTAFEEGKAKLPKLGTVKFRGGELPEGRLLSSRVWCDAGKWYMSSVFECQRPEYIIPKVARVGIDLGVKTLATAFDGEKIIAIEAPKALREAEKRLTRYQRRVSRRLKGSKRREAAKRRLTRLHQRVANIRKNAAHQATSMLVRHAHQIVVESLNVKGMMRNRHLAKSVADAGMGEFLRQITYKADWRQREVTEADRWYPSSRRCSACGEIHDMPLSKRWMSCACGNEMNRDENASRNLYAYLEERGNAGDILPKTRRERGVQELAAVPSPVPLNELRILKRGSEKRACVMYRFTEVNNSEDVDAA